MNKPKWKILGIDPASGKSSYCFTDDDDVAALLPKGPDGPIGPKELREFMREASQQDWANQLIIAWDAPLTAVGSLTTRQVERDWSKNLRESPYNTAGVAVRGYSGLSHWTISQYVLGHPTVGDSAFSDTNCGVYRPTSETSKGPLAVEVHPTLALWLWHLSTDTWRAYKGGKVSSNHSNKAPIALARQPTGNAHHGNKLTKGDRQDAAAFHIEWLAKRFERAAMNPYWLSPKCTKVQNEDALDARIAWLLGKLWIDTSSGVEFVHDCWGNGFLLPKTEASKVWRADAPRPNCSCPAEFMSHKWLKDLS